MADRVLVVGAGQMGNGIAHTFAVADIPVTMVDVSAEALARGKATITANLERQVKKGTITADARDAALARIAVSTELGAAHDAALVVEAATENIALKFELFSELDTIAPAGAILASNTSSISITEIAAHTGRPDRVIGMHFMNPVPVMRLVEVIRGLATSDETTATVIGLSKRLGKTPVEVRDYPGFVANRVLMPMINEAAYCVMEGVGTPEAIDTVMTLGMNHPDGAARACRPDRARYVRVDSRRAQERSRRSQVSRLSVAPEVRRGGMARPQDETRLLPVRLMREFLALTEEQREIQRVARDFAAEWIVPFAAGWDQAGEPDQTLVGRLAELGFLGMLIPPEYDGLGVDTTTYLLALEEIAAADASTAVLLSVHNSLPTQMILARGTDAQKERFLKPMARGEALGVFALSEPDAGSDAAALRTQAVRDGDCWVLNGTKAWVSNGNRAGVVLAMARTDTPGDRQGARGISAFIVTPDLPGFHVGKLEDKMGLCASPTVQLTFDNLRVPADRLLGAEGDGLAYALGSLENGRLGIAAQALGIGRAALEHSVRYAGERRQFGQPIRAHGAIQFKLADMATRYSQARALVFAAAAAKDRGLPITQLSSMAKLAASEMAMWVATQAVQVFGGYGYVKEYPVERLFRDAKVTEIYEGTSEIQRIVIGRSLYED